MQSEDLKKNGILECSKRISEFCSILVLSPLWAVAVTWSDYSKTCSKRLECNLNMIPFTVINCRHLFLYFHFTLSQINGNGNAVYESIRSIVVSSVS